jgi:hypothetical protein
MRQIRSLSDLPLSASISVIGQLWPGRRNRPLPVRIHFEGGCVIKPSAGQSAATAPAISTRKSLACACICARAKGLRVIIKPTPGALCSWPLANRTHPISASHCQRTLRDRPGAGRCPSRPFFLLTDFLLFVKVVFASLACCLRYILPPACGNSESSRSAPKMSQSTNLSGTIRLNASRSLYSRRPTTGASRPVWSVLKSRAATFDPSASAAEYCCLRPKSTAA